MCGIVGFVGSSPASPRVLDGLQRLEYRGYDSAGIALVQGSRLLVYKETGRVERLRQATPAGLTATCGVGHTRWATHGGVTRANAHPHTDPSGTVAVVHNGIIDNADVLRRQLMERGATFASETDTEVLAHLIGRAYSGDPLEAVREALLAMDDPALLESFPRESFVPADNDDYQPIEATARAIGLLDE